MNTPPGPPPSHTPTKTPPSAFMGGKKTNIPSSLAPHTATPLVESVTDEEDRARQLRQQEYDRRITHRAASLADNFVHLDFLKNGASPKKNGTQQHPEKATVASEHRLKKAIDTSDDHLFTTPGARSLQAHSPQVAPSEARLQGLLHEPRASGMQGVNELNRDPVARDQIIQHIKGEKNKAADGPSRTIFHDENCSPDSYIKGLVNIARETGNVSE
ncbi:hypothetical protein MMC12_000366 [Toensbergia leucococca]|nr:hypothetical protein [Toensbergia leucococca]